MDKAKIMRLCNEIEDEVTDIAFNSTHKHIYDCCESIREYLKAIAAEITAPPKSNGDRIRQMTEEELAKWFAPYMMCNECERRLKSYGCDEGECAKYALFYMKREVSEDAGTDDDCEE